MSSIRIVTLGLIICIALISSACAESEVAQNIAAPVYENEQKLVITIEETPSFIDEPIGASKPNEHLKYQWGINNIEYSNGTTTFWITNDNAPEINLTQIEIKNHETGEPIKFNYTNKVTKDMKTTANFWNLFGIFDSADKLSKDQTLKIILNGDYLNNRNIDISYEGVTITYYGKVKEN